MNEFLSGIANFFKERTQNPFSEKNKTPFAGAFIISFLIYNWELFYNVFSFDKTEDRLQQLTVIKQYININGWHMLTCPLFYSFISIVSFYTFNNVSLGITTIFNRWVKPFILNLIDRNKIIDKDSYNNLQNSFSKLSVQFEEIKIKNSSLIEEINVANNEVKSSNDKLFNLNFDNLKLLEKSKQHELEINSLKAENDLFKLKVKSIYAYDNAFNELNGWDIVYPPTLDTTGIIIQEDGYTKFVSTDKFNNNSASEYVTISKIFSTKITRNRNNSYYNFELNLQAASYSKLRHDDNDIQKRKGEMNVMIGYVPFLNGNPCTNFNTVYSNNRSFVKVTSQIELNSDIWETIILPPDSSGIAYDGFDSVQIIIHIKPGNKDDEIRLKDVLLFSRLNV